MYFGDLFPFTSNDAENFEARHAWILYRQTECYKSKLKVCLLLRHTATQQVNVICIHLHLFSYHIPHLEKQPSNKHTHTLSQGEYTEKRHTLKQTNAKIHSHIYVVHCIVHVYDTNEDKLGKRRVVTVQNKHILNESGQISAATLLSIYTNVQEWHHWVWPDLLQHWRPQASVQQQFSAVLVWIYPLNVTTIKIQSAICHLQLPREISFTFLTFLFSGRHRV